MTQQNARSYARAVAGLGAGHPAHFLRREKCLLLTSPLIEPALKFL